VFTDPSHAPNADPVVGGGATATTADGPSSADESPRDRESGGRTRDAEDNLDTLAKAHATVVSFDWKAVSRYLPAEMNALVGSGIVESLVQSRPVDGNGRPVPAFVHAATEFLEPILRSDWRAHIWGTGVDASWWLKRVGTVTIMMASGSHDPVPSVDTPDHGASVTNEEPGTPGYLEVPRPEILVDVAVVGGEVPEQCVGAILHRLSEHGLVVIENSDRAACADAVTMLGDAGWRRIDFWGLLPQFLFRGCTSVFFKDDRYVAPAETPDRHQSTFGPSFAQFTGQ
jgi:hypothetical protein